MVCQRSFVDCNKCTTRELDVDSQGSYSCVKSGAIWELSVLSAQYDCETKTALKNKAY